MKKLIFISALLIIAAFAFTPPYIPTTLKMRVTQIFMADSAGYMPDSYAPQFTTLDSIRRYWYDRATKSVWYHDGTTRQRIPNKAYLDSVIAAMGTSSQRYLYKFPDVSLTAVFRVPSDSTAKTKGRLILTSVTYVVKNQTGTVVTPPEISIGLLSPFDDIVANVALPSTPIINNPKSLTILPSALSVTANTVINLKVNTAATFALSGEYTVDIYLNGYYETQ